MQFQYFSKMETSVRVLPQWMLESTNQQNAHTTTASPYKKQKRSASFYGRIKRRVPLQDVSNSKKSRLQYYKEKKRVR